LGGFRDPGPKPDPGRDAETYDLVPGDVSRFPGPTENVSTGSRDPPNPVKGTSL